MCHDLCWVVHCLEKSCTLLPCYGSGGRGGPLLTGKLVVWSLAAQVSMANYSWARYWTCSRFSVSVEKHYMSISPLLFSFAFPSALFCSWFKDKRLREMKMHINKEKSRNTRVCWLMEIGPYLWTDYAILSATLSLCLFSFSPCLREFRHLSISLQAMQTDENDWKLNEGSLTHMNNSWPLVQACGQGWEGLAVSNIEI